MGPLPDDSLRIGAARINMEGLTEKDANADGLTSVGLRGVWQPLAKNWEEERTRMNWHLSFIVAVSFAMILSARAPEANSTAARRTRLKALLLDEWEYTLRTNPELATSVGDNRFNDRLSDYSAKAFAAQ